MTVLVSKCRDFFSDFWLQLALFFNRKKKSPEEITKAVQLLEKKAEEKPLQKIQSKPELKPEPKVGIMPVVEKAPAPKEGGAQIIDLRTKKAKEKTERIKNAKFPFALRHLRLSKKSRLYFYDQMSTLIGSGVPLVESLSLIQAQEKNKTLKRLYAEMIHEVSVGLSLAEAMELFPHIFPKMQCALVEAAEASGNLKEVLAELVEGMEADQDFATKITGAMVYPIILVFLAIILVTGMMIFVIPKIAVMYDQANVKLPALTQAVIDISDFMVQKWPLLIGGITSGVLFLYIFFSKVKIGKFIAEILLSAIPMAGRINKEKNIMLIAANMGMLLKSGVLITEAFAITQNTIDNLHFQRALEKIRQGVIMGKDVSQMMGLIDIQTQQFKEHKLFPLQVAQLIRIGEKTGTIANMLLKIKKNYHKSIDASLKNISTLIEPVMIFMVAALVGSILMAVMLPFFYIGSTIH